MEIFSVRRCSFLPICIWVIGGFLLLGCGKRASGPATVEVTGTVTFDAKPVEAANVTFSPLASGENVTFAASTGFAPNVTVPVTSTVAGPLARLPQPNNKNPPMTQMQIGKKEHRRTLKISIRNYLTICTRAQHLI